MPESLTHLDEGNTNSYLVQASVVILAGIGLCFVHWAVGVPVLLFGIAIAMLKTGLTFDGKRKRVRKYARFFNMYFGNWISLEKYTVADLQLYREKGAVRGRGASFDTLTQRYEVYLHAGFKEKFLLHDFDEYDMAKQALRILKDDFGMETNNSIAENIRNSKRRRR